MSRDVDDLAVEVVRVLRAAGATVATAESLTGGLVGAAITGVAGSSAAYAGGVVSYATRVKVDVLGVPPEVVAQDGVVSPRCAAAMAEGVRRVLGTDFGLATTGVAGPDLQEGKPAGTAFVAVAGPAGTRVTALQEPGGREEIRAAVVGAVLTLLLDEASHAEGENSGREVVGLE